jgi:tetratricopeptide (TPR) repeat protein
VKNLLTDAKNIVERGSSDEDFNEALQMLNKAINKAASVQVSNTYHLYYYRGICYLNLKELEKAERDFIESSSLADEKGKVQIYSCLGRCKVEMAEEDPSYVNLHLFSLMKPSSVTRKPLSLVRTPTASHI